MQTFQLPFDILGQVGPILAWVERADSGPLPETWSSMARPFRERENGWLLRELPTYSYDSVEEIVIGTRFRHRRQAMRPAKLPFLEDRRRQILDPPHDYSLLQAFHRLNNHFLIWNGTEPCIRAGHMEELHELALRLPAGHIVRHGHARAVAEGIIQFKDALDLPENITYLPSNSFGLRNVVRKGLSESHLHLSGVTSAEETWADSLLKPTSPISVRGVSPEERRLLVINLFAGRILALAVWMSLIDHPQETGVRPKRLLQLLDRLYFARNHYVERWAALELQREIQAVVFGHDARGGEPPIRGTRLDEYREKLAKPREELETLRQARNEHRENNGASYDGPQGKKLRQIEREIRRRQLEITEIEQRAASESTMVGHPVPEEYNFLLRWLSPTAWRIQKMSTSGGLPGNLPEGLDDRLRLVHSLHLAAHLQLIRSSTRQEKGQRDDRLPGDKKLSPQFHFLHRAMFRYIVCRTHHWQMATQQGKTTGLRHFKRFFDSAQRRPRDITDLQKSELVFNRLRQWRGLRVLEGRVAPPSDAHELVPWVLAYARPEDRKIQKFGLVAHFKKEPEDQEDPVFSSKTASPALRLRWGKRRRRVRDEAMRLYRILRRPTPIVPFIVGIDACNLELSTPPEVFAPAFRFLREFPVSLMGDPRHFAPYAGLDHCIRSLVEKRRLGMTYHVGEDFRHLLSGLRAICEVVDFLAPNPGDRLGHGTALALSPERWMENNSFQAVMPKLEWLDTLIWVHHFLGPGDNLVGELAIEDLIQRYSWEIYSPAIATHYDPLGFDSRGDSGRPGAKIPKGARRGFLDWDWSPLTLWDAWMLRQLDPYSVDIKELLRGQLKMREGWIYTEEERRWQSVQERVMRRVRRNIGSRNAYVLLALYWLDPGVRQRGHEVTIVDMQEHRDQWLELCCRVEDRMKTLIHERELVVEVNPSANRIIGPMSRYDQHHVFQLTLDDEKRLAREVRVSVNTDNPAVCHTTLAHEYYLIGEILIHQGVPEAEVVKWLDWLRQNGEEYNFVRHLKTPEESPAMRHLLDWLRGIRKSVREARTREGKRHAFWQWLRETHLRSHHFAEHAIAEVPDLLERLVSLEHRLRQSEGAGVEATGDLEGRLRALEKALESLRR